MLKMVSALKFSPVAIVGLGAAIPSGFYCVRNVEKTLDGHVGRAGVAAGQAKNLVNTVRAIDNAVGATTKTAVDALKVTAESDKLLRTTNKALNYASKNINKLIVGSSVLDIALAEDKEQATYSNVGALASMFAFEKLVKSKAFKNSKPVSTAATKMKSVLAATKCSKASPILKAVSYVACDLAAYNLGEKLFGKVLLGKVRASRTEKQEGIKSNDANGAVSTYNA